MASAGHTSPSNGGNNVIKGKVGGRGDGLSGMVFAPAGPKSQSNGGDNDVEGKVRGGGDGVEEEVGGEKGNSKIDERDKTNLLYSIHQFLISYTGTIGINLAKLTQTRKCLIKTVHADSVVDCHGLQEGDKILAPRLSSEVEHSDVYNLFLGASKHRPLLLEIKRPNKPTSNANIVLLEDHSLHQFTITKSDPLGILLEINNTKMVLIKSVTANSLGDIYGLQKNDILASLWRMGN